MTLRQPTFGHGGKARSDEEVTSMVSKALASLDAWLELAESVLEEQREEGLPAGEDLRLLPAAEPWNGRER